MIVCQKKKEKKIRKNHGGGGGVDILSFLTGSPVNCCDK